jgi:nitroreductase
LAAPNLVAAHPPPLCRPSRCRAAVAAAARRGILGFVEIRFSAGFGDPRHRPESARPFGRIRRGIGSAPVFLVFCGDARRLERIGEPRPKANDNGRLEGFFNATVDAALALQTFILVAESAGLGCCPISIIRNHAAAVAAILELPDKVFPVAGLCLGYPAQEGHLGMRLPLALTVHTDRYGDTRLPPLVDAYDRRRGARYSIPRGQYRAFEIFGDAGFYGWSEDKARQAAAQPEGEGFCRLAARPRLHPRLEAPTQPSPS